MMTIRRIVVVISFIVVIALGLLAFYVFRPPEAASGPLEAVPLALPTTAPLAQPTAAPATTVVAEATTTSALPTTATEPVLQLFAIDQSRSEARFLIDEVLRGQPVTVVGVTNQVAGQIALDPNVPTAAQVGVIQINARTLATDNEFRNRAIKNAILRTNQFELITFTPRAINGLPDKVTIGVPFEFTIEGDLTITDVTRPVTFTVTVTPVSQTEISGVAKTAVLYRDFNLIIPDSPSVDTVADEVRLELEFVATLVG
ncbi:YceI family protein [uncultured Chloroflexus sp.]|uniref:YceI family protein n=1 Tax=uncultured Chloroflexus sp. TaxID=214040 RepID=UPI00262DC2AA|nr:YceI family protein [uncultured Chloroflexus sp.]